MVREQSVTRLSVLAAGSALALAVAMFALHWLPLADLAQKFGIPSLAGGIILNIATAGGAVATIVGILVGLGSGGLALIAAAGRATIRKFLLDQIEEKGRRAVIAW